MTESILADKFITLPMVIGNPHLLKPLEQIER